MTMMTHYREFIRGDETDVNRLIEEVFNEFVAPGYTDDGNRFFLDFIKPVNILQRFNAGNMIVLGFVDGKLAGMIEMQNLNHICLLFTRKEFHRLGIARNLFQICLDRIPADAGISVIEVNASPYSVDAYRSLGFEPVSDFKEINGITFLPMEMKLRI